MSPSDSRYPTQEIPMQQIVDGVARGRILAKPARVLPFERIAEAHRLVEANSVEGKIVVVMSEGVGRTR